MRKFSVLKRRLERLETAKRPKAPTAHVCIFDPVTREPVNGPIPESATTVLYLPDNGRGGVTYENE